jgi:hypothetical protein
MLVVKNPRDIILSDASIMKITVHKLSKFFTVAILVPHESLVGD